MHFNLLSFLPLASMVLADGNAIQAAMAIILADSVKLNATIAPWTGNPLTLIPIIVESAELLSAINNATSVAQASANLTLLEVFGIAESTIALGSNVNSTLDTIIAKKKVFQRELLQPVILLNLLAEKAATDKFAAAVVGKVPVALQATAKNLIAPIDAAFGLAIADYETIFG